MQSFLSKVVYEVLQSETRPEEITFVLPNKRSGLFLKNHLKTALKGNTFLPRIISIEDLVKEISGFELLDNVSLLFEFYAVYKTCSPKGKTDRFEDFSKWASILLQDFNDIDSNLFDADDLLDYLHDSKRIEQWNLKENSRTELIDNYLSFFENIKTYHQFLWKHLCSKKMGYQGLVYRIASERIQEYLSAKPREKFIFAGFNALNKSEEKIIQKLLFLKRADIYWDDDVFYNNSNNQSQQFFKKYKREWPHYINHDFKWQASCINRKKTIYLYGLPKNISQIKHAGTLIKELHLNHGIEDTAVILGNEKLLPSLLNSIPEEIPKANITMGYELQNVALSSLFESIFKLHLNRSKWKKENAFYHKDVSAVINDPFFQVLWINHNEFAKNFKNLLFQDRAIFITEQELLDLANGSRELTELFHIVFLDWDSSAEALIDKFGALIEFLRATETQNNLYQEYLYRFHNIFLQLSNLNRDFGFIDNLNTLYQIFHQILKTEKLSFQGEPLEGLQIMGLLESRVLDFKHVIITSVNEGFLPAGGSNNSFIPLDIKTEKKMPTFFDRDAIFSYHFFRLFHRAEHIHLLYNNITDDFGSGEPSRFIRQLEAAKELGQLEHVDIIKKIISPRLNPLPLVLNSIEKTEDVLLRLLNLASKGFSPSSLGNYIRNPLDFYKRSVLGIEEFEEVEETIASKTFGTVIHDSLEQLYLPLKGKFLNKSIITDLKSKMTDEVIRQFRKSYSVKSIRTGKNYLSFEIAKQFILNYLNHELSELERGKKIKILGLEESLTVSHQVKGLDFPVRIKGKIDRIDEVDGVMRILDYKTGKVGPSQLKITDWNLLTTEEKYTKSFQVLTYAYLYQINHPKEDRERSLESGIVSFKNLKYGFMKFNNDLVTDETLKSYINELDHLLLEIFDETIPFREKELPVFSF